MRMPHRSTGCEITVAVVQKDPVGLAIVSDHDIEVTVGVDIGHRYGVARRVLHTQGICPAKDPVARVEKQQVLLRPVAPIRHDGVQVTVGVHVAELKRSRKVLGYA
jgi:hypothetical protein